jgi:hypothetical protein
MFGDRGMHEGRKIYVYTTLQQEKTVMEEATI